MTSTPALRTYTFDAVTITADPLLVAEVRARCSAVLIRCSASDALLEADSNWDLPRVADLDFCAAVLVHYTHITEALGLD